jgi:FkbM family methyltransferase
MNPKQIILLTKRAFTASLMRVAFYGTSRFRLPRSYYFNGRNRSIFAPSEAGLSNDFINLLLDDEYGLKTLKSYPQTIVDIGGNIGLFSQMAGALFPKARIHSYEPNPRIHGYLAKNLSQVGAEFFPEEVGAEAGSGQSIDAGDSRTGVFEKGGNIPIVSFSMVVDRIGGRIDLLKLDCEGGEWDIFQIPEPFQKVAEIRMEYHLVGGKTISDLKDAAEHIGFKITKLNENSGFGIAWMTRKGKGKS